MIFKIAYRLLKRHLAVMLLIALISTFSVGLFCGMYDGAKSLDVSLNKYISDYNYPEVVVQTDVVNKGEFSKIKDVTGISEYETGLVFDVAMRINDSRIESRVFSYQDGGIFKFYYHEYNEEIDSDFTCLLDYEFAKDNNIKIGDVFQIYINEILLDITVKGLISTPNNLQMYKDEFSFGKSGNFGFIYINQECFNKTTVLRNIRNMLYVKSDGSRSNLELLNDIKTKISKSIYINGTTFEDSFIQMRIEDNVYSMYSLAKVIPIAFLLISLALTSIFFSLIIKSEKKSIATMTSLGIEPKDIFKIFLIMSLTVNIVGFILGIALNFLIMEIVLNVYKDFFQLPSMITSVDFTVIFLSFISTIVVSILSIVISTIPIIKNDPSKEIRKTYKNKKIKVKNYNLKLPLLLILRDPKKALYFLISMVLSNILIFSALMFNESKNRLIKELYDYRISYDAEVYAKKDGNILLNDIKSLSYVNNAEIQLMTSTTIEFNGISKRMQLDSYDNMDGLVKIVDRKNKTISSFEDGTITLEYHMAKMLGCKVGDTVLVNGYELKVSKINNHHIQMISYTDMNTLLGISKTHKEKILVDYDISHEKEFINYLMENELFSCIELISLSRVGNERIFKVYSIGTIIILVIAILISSLSIYNGKESLIEDYKKEISIGLSIGFSNTKIVSIILIENIFIYIISLLISYPIGIPISKFFLNALSVHDREYPLVFSLSLFLFTFLISFFTLLISILSTYRTLSKIDLIEETKLKD